jgi:putative transposase
MTADFFGGRRGDRESVPEAFRRMEAWPTVDASALSPARQQVYAKRVEALTLYLTVPEQSVAAISIQTGIDRKTIARLVGRCTTTHKDGRLYGYRGAVPGLRIKEYERLAPVRVNGKGKAGAFKQLLQRYPTIEASLKRAFIERSRQIKTEQEVRKSMRSIHRAFRKHCQEAGIKADEYPFTERRLAIRSLYAYFDTLAKESFEMSVKHAGGLRARAAPTAVPHAPAATRAFEVVEFDGHKIDLRLTVKLRGSAGVEQLVEMHRIWILVLLDVATRCVIGYHLTLSREYSKHDVACALQAALTPFKPRQYGIPTLAIREGGGFPSAVVQGAQYACWDWFKCDNAKSHLAADTITRLTQTIGCWPHLGPPGEPNDRPHIERFFHLVSRHFAHALPGNLGSNPQAIERALSDPKGNTRLLVTLDELEDMIEVLVADYNGEPHAALDGRTPLEAMTYSVGRHADQIRVMPQVARANLCLLQEAKIVTVKGTTLTGLRPHINFCNVRYTSPILASSPALIGKKLRMYFDPRDIRTVKVFFEDGGELGILTAARPWGIPPHSLKVRQEIFRLIAERKLELREGDNPIEAWVRLRMGQRDRKHVAGQLATQQRLEDAHAAPAPDTSAADEPFIAVRRGPPVLPVGPIAKESEQATEHSDTRSDAKVVPLNLTLRKTFTF